MLSKERVYVLDSFAVLAYLEGEYSADRIRRLLSDDSIPDIRIEHVSEAIQYRSLDRQFRF